MDWLSIGKLIAPMAPFLGGVLGGFIPVPGGALAGQALGNVIAKAFGVDATPTAVSNAITNSPNEVVLARLNAAADEARSMWPAYAETEKAYFAAQVDMAKTVNQTMQIELANPNASKFQTWWRPSCGWLFVLMAFVFGMLLMWATAKAIMGDAVPLKMLSDAWPLYAAYLGGLAAMVGVYTVTRSQEKVALTAAVPNVVKAPAPISILKKK